MMAVDLATLSEAGKGVEAAPELDFEPLPPGNYQVQIESCIFKLTRAEDYWMLAFKMRVLAGKHKGRIHFWNHLLNHNDPEKLSWYRRDIERLGFPKGGDLATIGDYTERFCNQIVEINIKRGTRKNNNDEFPLFTRLNKILDASGTPEDGSPGGPAGNFEPPSMEESPF